LHKISVALVTCCALWAGSAFAQTPQTATVVLQHKNTVYQAIYDGVNKRLDCVSANTGCEWRTTVATGVQSIVDFAGVATPGGPLFVYSQGNDVRFAMPHFRTGKTVTPMGSRPMSGVFGPGRLHSVLFRVGLYGAETTVEAIKGERKYTYKWDINVHGSSKPLQDPVSEPFQSRVSNEAIRLSLQLPRGFTCTPTPEAFQFVGPVPGVRMMIVGAEADVSLEEFTKLFLSSLSEELQLKELARQTSQLGEGEPCLIIMANGVSDGQPLLFGLVTFANDGMRYALVYGAAPEWFDAYAGCFYELMGTIELK